MPHPLCSQPPNKPHFLILSVMFSRPPTLRPVFFGGFLRLPFPLTRQRKSTRRVLKIPHPRCFQPPNKPHPPKMSPPPRGGPGAGAAPAEKEDATPPIFFLSLFFKKKIPQKIGMSVARAQLPASDVEIRNYLRAHIQGTPQAAGSRQARLTGRKRQELVHINPGYESYAPLSCLSDCPSLFRLQFGF